MSSDGGAWWRVEAPQRASLTVWGPGVGSTSSTAEVEVPGDWEELWGSLPSLASAVVVDPATGEPATYQWRPGSSVDDRIGALQVAWPAPVGGAKALHLWLYWGEEGGADYTDAVTPSSPMGGVVEQAGPAGRDAVVDVAAIANDLPRVVKTSASTLDVWLDLGRCLQQRRTPSADRRGLEAIASAEVAVTSEGSAVTGMCAHDDLALAGGTWVRARVSGGDSGTGYTLAVAVTTSLGRVIEARVAIDVSDPQETA